MTPSRRLVSAVLGLTALAAAGAAVPALRWLWPPAAGLLGLLAALDLYQALGVRSPRVAREMPRGIPSGVRSKVQLRVENTAPRTLALRLHDHHPAHFRAEGLPLALRIPPRRQAAAGYRLTPQRRGDALFPGLDLIIDSPWGLWRRRVFVPLETRVKVFPNFHEIRRYALLATEHNLNRMGVRKRRRRGEGNDFHQLRDYRPGDSLRQIHWTATSRYQRLISKEYQDERDQQVVFLIDCGRRMRHLEGGRAHLDEVLNAMLLLAYVASRQGDAVGFLAFGGVRRWRPPQKGGDVVTRLLEQTYDLESTLEASDYLMAAKELIPLQRRRSLVVLLTNTRDDDREELERAMRLLAKRHLVVLADLRESLLDQTLEHPVRSFDDALRFHAVDAYRTERQRNHDLMQHHGAITLDLLASQLPVALVNQYLNVKASGRL